MSELGEALFSKTQQKDMGLLFTRPDKSFYTKEILRLTGMGVATIKRELDRMVSVGILTLTKLGNQHHYQANKACPIYCIKGSRACPQEDVGGMPGYGYFLEAITGPSQP